MPRMVPVCIQNDLNIMSVYIPVLCGNVTCKRKKIILNWEKKFIHILMTINIHRLMKEKICTC